MQPINVVIVPVEFIDNYFNEITLPEVKVFLTLCRLTIGYAGNVKTYIPVEEICKKASLSVDAVKPAIKRLEDRRLVQIEHRKGRGRPNGYTIVFGNKIVAQNPPFKTGGLKPTLFDLEESILLGGPGQKKPTSAATPPPDKPANVKKRQSVKSRSEEEHAVFKETWEAFETALGTKLSSKEARLEAKSIWEIIDRMNNGNGWREDLKEIISRFISYVKNPPRQFSYLAQCLPLPHILNSSRTWVRMVVKPQVQKQPTIEETEEWFNGLKEKGVISR